MVRLRLRADDMAEICADPPAQVEPDAARFHIDPPDSPGISLLENPRQILRRDADPGVADQEEGAGFRILCSGDFGSVGTFGSLRLDRNDPSRTRVFLCVGKHLLDHEKQPLFVGGDRLTGWIVCKTDFSPNKLTGKLF